MHVNLLMLIKRTTMLTWNSDKKGDTQLLQNYRPVSLLPTGGKIFERIIFKPIFEYLEKIVFSVQITLVFIHLTHVKTNYYQSFIIFMLILINIQLQMRANFLDILKAFDKVWHEGLLFKLEHIGISGNLSLLKSFLSNRFQ